MLIGYAGPFGDMGSVPGSTVSLRAYDAGPLGFLGLAVVGIGLQVIYRYERRTVPFNPMVPTVLWWLLSGIGLSLWSLEQYVAPRNLPALLVMASGWLLLAVLLYLAMRKTSRKLGR